MSAPSIVSSAPVTDYSSASQRGLQTELAKLKREQSACVNCESAKTQGGKLNIQKLSTAIVSVESKIEKVQASQANDSTNATQSSAAKIDLYA